MTRRGTRRVSATKKAGPPMAGRSAILPARAQRIGARGPSSARATGSHSSAERGIGGTSGLTSHHGDEPAARTRATRCTDPRKGQWLTPRSTGAALIILSELATPSSSHSKRLSIGGGARGTHHATTILAHIY